MGLRAYAVTHYEKEFGDCLGFNYDLDGFIEFIEKLNIEFYIDEDKTLIELNTKELLALNSNNLDLEQEELKLLLILQRNAKGAIYAKESYFRVEWL
ncbi:hypothetical protein YZ46_07550 [Campylobacter upsaliensis]|nr:hypothetical protein [Campylobacter upsaliensis]EAL3929243.1 hypothetical protein [Campylobacter upsaliensis]ECP4380524.1 hypothetical protein [Campylobacter upsaliensis]